MPNNSIHFFATTDSKDLSKHKILKKYSKIVRLYFLERNLNNKSDFAVYVRTAPFYTNTASLF